MNMIFMWDMWDEERPIMKQPHCGDATELALDRPLCRLLAASEAMH